MTALHSAAKHGWNEHAGVRNYLSASIRKLGARNRREAIDRAIEKGWL